MASETSVTLMSLPVEMIDKILSYLSYDQIAKLRAVNCAFNIICSHKLNKGFIHVEQFHGKCVKSVKSKLPRRESERKNHPLSRHSDILMAVETRLSMLSMTYTKFIDDNHCCFIPGKVLDEALKVLQIVTRCLALPIPSSQTMSLPRPHDFLQEYRDISSMAMEHFDEKILPSIREKIKKKNPRMYCGKHRPVRTFLLGMRSARHPIPGDDRCGSAATSTSHQPLAPTDNVEETSSEMVTMPITKLVTMLRHRKTKCSNTQRAVVMLNRNVRCISNKWNIQNIVMKRRLSQQKVIIKHMRRELRETRAAMNIMSKDLNRLKIELNSTREQANSDRPSGSNLTVTKTSSLNIPVPPPSLSSESKGLKRKLNSSDENNCSKR